MVCVLTGSFQTLLLFWAFISINYSQSQYRIIETIGLEGAFENISFTSLISQCRALRPIHGCMTMLEFIFSLFLEFLFLQFCGCGY